MRHTAKLAALLGAGVVATATACGSGANALTGRSPAQVVQLAAAQLSGQSYQMAFDGRVTFDASQVKGIPQAEVSQLTGAMSNLSLGGRADVQNQQRVRMTVSVALAGITKAVTAVLYDGHFYVSLGGDGRFADAGSFDLQGLPVSPSDIRSALGGAGPVTDLGLTVHNGVRVDHLRAPLNATYLRDRMGKVTGSGAAASAANLMGALFAQVIQVRDGSVDAYVRPADGRLDATEVRMTFALDMARLVTLLTTSLHGHIPAGSGVGDISGTLVMGLDATSRFSGYGTRITVARPSVDPGAPRLPSTLFGGTP